MTRVSLVLNRGFLWYSKGIPMDLTWIFFGSRSVGTERDPKEIRTSSEGDPLESRIKLLANPS